MNRYKKIYDPVHGFIDIDAIEYLFINSQPFQRLRYIHQLGATYFVYPGATHRRFEHSLGVMDLATKIFDTLTLKPFHSDVQEMLPRTGSHEYRYWRRVLRLAALAHDLGHLPFSHVAEHALLGKAGHEIWTQKILNSDVFNPVWEAFSADLTKDGLSKNVKEDVIKIALGPNKYFAQWSPWEKIVSEILTGDFFGADRIDYLLRDSRSSGLAYGLFDYHQLIVMLTIIKNNHGQLVLGVEENGMESCEALLLARHYMHKRIYQYPNVKAYTFHVSRFMKAAFSSITDSLEIYLNTSDNEVLAAITKAAANPELPGSDDAQCICCRENRFKAISYPPHICNSEILDQLRQKLQLTDALFSWKHSSSGSMLKNSFMNFPVLMGNNAVFNGRDLSEVSIKQTDKIWVYIAPKYADAVVNFLNNQ